MCDTCGCNITHGNAHLIAHGGKLSRTESGTEAVTLLHGLLHENDHAAAHNREHFNRHGVLAVNLMSSPGAGKTSLLESTIVALRDEFSIAVIEGDLETENDALRIRKQGVPAVQITTGSACHLDAHMVHDALHHIELDNLDIIFIENVGNLVCPASFDLGQHRNITLLSVPEGDDKPAKYPVMFRGADLVLLSKIDLLPVLDDFQPEKAVRYLRELANPAPVYELSARNGAGMDQWLHWLREQVALADTRSGNNDTPVDVTATVS
ncbi:MAG: hydrogenase nickel incorporation protein HypB [Gammaproteobacteria bacterium]